MLCIYVVYNACTKLFPSHILLLINLVLSAEVGTISVAWRRRQEHLVSGEGSPARRACLAENVAIWFYFKKVD